jgi:hypothetical protein
MSGPTTREEALDLVAAITVRALRRAAAYDAERARQAEAAGVDRDTRPGAPPTRDARRADTPSGRSGAEP